MERESIQEFGNDHNTSEEIVEAIFEIAKTEKKRERVWADPTDAEARLVGKRAFELADEKTAERGWSRQDELHWGQETISRTRAAA